MELIEKALYLASEKIQTDTAEAETLCRQVLRVDPGNLSGRYLLARCSQLLGMDEEYSRLMSEVAEAEPESSEAQNNLGISLLHLKQYGEAKKHFLKAVKLDPGNSSAWTSLACCLRLSGDYETAISIMEMCDDRTPEGLVSLAGAYMERGDVDRAIETLEGSLRLNPDHPSTRLDLACALYLKGYWEMAGDLYMSRFAHYEKLTGSPCRYPREKMWNGDDVGDERVLLFCEQGLGDAINFARFCCDFRTKFPLADIRVDAPSDLRDFLSHNGFDVSEGEEYDLCCSVMDLPHLLGMSKEDVRDSFRPMRPNRKCDFSAFDGLLKVGVCWGGNPLHARDEFRSMRLSEFRKLGIPGVKLFSLQKDKRPRVWHSSERVVDLGSDCEDMRLVDMSPHMRSWDDTAAIVDGMDIVISVDTSILHLAASMGKKTWGLIATPPDWRWGMSGRESPWYPSLRLFRQKERGNWAGVMTEVRSELVKEL